MDKKLLKRPGPVADGGSLLTQGQTPGTIKSAGAINAAANRPK